ncbi:MAG TPA: porin [Ramlibacter sp.]|uniref:porin n=1 Tax=Ramlibacter sp. TaxID=1917967 RepID=UPI002ECFF934
MRLKKLTVAASIAAGFAAPALAQNVQIYGKLYPYLLQERGSGPTAAGTPVATFAGTPTGTSGVGKVVGMQAGNSRLGFRGSEDLGGGMKALFQLEGVASVDDGTGNGDGAFQFNRNTFVGLKGGFGTVKLGNLDTIFKEYGDALGILGISSGTFLSSSDVLRKTGFGTSSASSFHLRRANSIQYESPEVADFTFGLQYSTDEAPSAENKEPKLWSAGVRYENGPWYVSLAHERHRDFFGGSRNVRSGLRNNGATTNSHSTDSATQLAVVYEVLKGHKLEFDIIRKSYSEEQALAGRFSSYRNMAYMFAFENRWTPQWTTAGHIVRASRGTCSLNSAAPCSTDGLEATKYTLAAGYNLSKRTMLFGAFSLIKNGKSARFSNAEFNSSEPAPGEDIRQLAIGISHSF